MDFNSIYMIGLGYIGLPKAAVLASHKVNVIGLDINQDTINRGISSKCTESATELYKIFVQGSCIAVNARTIR